MQTMSELVNYHARCSQMLKCVDSAKWFTLMLLVPSTILRERMFQRWFVWYGVYYAWCFTTVSLETNSTFINHSLKMYQHKLFLFKTMRLCMGVIQSLLFRTATVCVSYQSATANYSARPHPALSNKKYMLLHHSIIFMCELQINAESY